jgi:predicted nucleic acid-binding protein
VIVVDASALVAALVDDGETGKQSRDALRDDPRWAAPSLLPVEVLASLRGLVLGRKLGTERAADAVTAVRLMVIDQLDPATLVTRIWELRGNLTAYDAAYVAAAEALGCTLVTADSRIARAPGPRCAIRVIE